MASSFPLRSLTYSCAFAIALASLSLFVCTAQAQEPPASDDKQVASSKSAPHASPRQIRQAEDAYLSGARLLDKGDLAGAEARFAKAAALNPENAEYVQARALAREHRVTDLVQQAGKARMLGKNDRAQQLLAEARKLDPGNTIITQHTDPTPVQVAFRPEIQAVDNPSSMPWLQQVPAIAGPVTLLPSPGLQTFEIRGDSQDT